MIRQATFQNFKALRDVRVTLGRLAVIVGPNSSGKSSVLHGLHLLSLLGWALPETVFSGRNAPEHLISRGGGNSPLTLGCTTDEGAVELHATPPTVPARDEPDPWPPEPRWTYDLQWWDAPAADAAPLSAERQAVVQRLLRSSILLRLDAARLTSPSYSRSAVPLMRSTGQELPSALAHLALNQPEAFQDLQRRMREVLPTFERIRFGRTPVSRSQVETVTIGEESVTRRVRREYMGDSLLFDMKGAPSLPAHAVSEGTALLLGMLSVLTGPGRPRRVLIDDIDRGLHPKAQREFVKLLRSLLDQDPGLQVVGTSHSPYFLDELRPEEVLLTTLNDRGETACASLVEHPEFPRWKDEMTPGEFWSTVGEKWVTAGK